MNINTILLICIGIFCLSLAYISNMPITQEEHYVIDWYDENDVLLKSHRKGFNFEYYRDNEITYGIIKYSNGTIKRINNT